MDDLLERYRPAMEDEIAQLEMRGDELWDLLQDPTLPPLDRDELARELDENTHRLMEIERQAMEELVWLMRRMAEFDCDSDDAESCDSESIGPDEYDREGVIIYGQPDFM